MESKRMVLFSHKAVFTAEMADLIYAMVAV